MRAWLSGLVNWPKRSQRTSRRNAQQAAISLAHERRERERVDREVARLVDRRTSSRAGEQDAHEDRS